MLTSWKNCNIPVLGWSQTHGKWKTSPLSKIALMDHSKRALMGTHASFVCKLEGPRSSIEFDTSQSAIETKKISISFHCWGRVFANFKLPSVYRTVQCVWKTSGTPSISNAPDTSNTQTLSVLRTYVVIKLTKLTQQLRNQAISTNGWAKSLNNSLIMRLQYSPEHMKRCCIHRRCVPECMVLKRSKSKHKKIQWQVIWKSNAGPAAVILQSELLAASGHSSAHLTRSPRRVHLASRPPA